MERKVVSTIERLSTNNIVLFLSKGMFLINCDDDVSGMSSKSDNSGVQSDGGRALKFKESNIATATPERTSR
jgi:hypothetical protein